MDEKKNIDQATTVTVDETAVSMEGAEDELASMFAEDIDKYDVETNISEDLAGFANGFPDWDLHPPKK